ncbi:MAG: prolyl oligopeptidase family serine peptidase, partial [Ilumatobacteraceae bacterium]
WPRHDLLVGPVEAWDHLGPAELPEPDAVTIDAGGVTLHARGYRAVSDSGTGSGRMICWIHGGPTDQWQVEFMPRVAYWVARGWDVLAVDPRGTTGHGRSYQQALHGGWGRIDVDDTATAIRHAHARGWAEPSTTVVMGGSSGGLTVLGVLGLNPGLAVGGVVSYPVCDLAELSERSHRFEAHYTLSLVGPLEDTELYRERSPLSYADQIDVPLLVMHGDADPVVPVEQSIRLADRVRSSGGDVELHLVEGEGHGFRHPASKLDEYERIGRFLQRVVPRRR